VEAAWLVVEVAEIAELPAVRFESCCQFGLEVGSVFCDLDRVEAGVEGEEVPLGDPAWALCESFGAEVVDAAGLAFLRGPGLAMKCDLCQ
jgi:hypothetical protein